MNAVTQILSSIDLWLRQNQYYSVLNLTYTVGRPCYGGVPNICLPDNHRALLMVVDQRLVVYMNRRSVELQLSDPSVFEQLLELLDAPES